MRKKLTVRKTWFYMVLLSLVSVSYHPYKTSKRNAARAFHLNVKVQTFVDKQQYFL
jgi:hypothetical protein